MRLSWKKSAMAPGAKSWMKGREHVIARQRDDVTLDDATVPTSSDLTRCVLISNLDAFQPFSFSINALTCCATNVGLLNFSRRQCQPQPKRLALRLGLSAPQARSCAPSPPACIFQASKNTWECRFWPAEASTHTHQLSHRGSNQGALLSPGWAICWPPIPAFQDHAQAQTHD